MLDGVHPHQQACDGREPVHTLVVVVAFQERGKVGVDCRFVARSMDHTTNPPCKRHAQPMLKLGPLNTECMSVLILIQSA